MRTESTRWASVALLTMAGVWLLQLGCGPCFPNRLLLLGDDVLNRMQGREFKALVRELVPRKVGTLIALPDAGYGFTYQDSDDWSALVTAGVITERDGAAFVLTPLPEGGTQEVPVTLGLKGDVGTEIRSGLAVGDTVVVPEADEGAAQFPQGGIPGGPN